ncbi:MAG: hypothetical protein J2P17_15010, partial [Mycobacterium sp.]|nr:hypothetical protein [Mycobacterium sp.]
MTVPYGPAPSLLRNADVFDVPVIVRYGSPLAPTRRPTRRRVDAATEPWPTTSWPAPTGDYLVSTTWREVLDAAFRMGRDPTPWLAWSHRLAWAEMVARQSPLFAYLARTPANNGSGSGFAIEPNPVFIEGAERTAQVAFGYRLGMTIADWACRGLMGLGPTVHAEMTIPDGAGADWNVARGLPDLTGVHPRDGKIYLIEAKGGRKVGQPALRKGAEQLIQPGIMVASHMRVLAGASIEHRLIVTLDIEDWSPRPRLRATQPRSVESNDAYLLDNTQSRMLTYYALSAMRPDELAVLPVGSAVGQKTDRPGLLTRLEGEPTTLEARSRSVPRAVEPYDMLVGQVPNTGLYIGLSRRQYGACRALADAQRRLLPRDDWLANRPARVEFFELNDNDIAQGIRRREQNYLHR